MIAMRFARHIAVAATFTVTGLIQATAPAAAEPVTQEIRNQTLAEANVVRAKFGARPLMWHDALYPAADAWARNCKFQHSNSQGTYGETLYVISGSPSPGIAIRSAFQAWAAEASRYNYNSPGFSASTGNFTQVVWKNTTGLAIAIGRCAADTILPMASTYIVARFTAPGNFIGQFPQNVGRPMA